MSVVQLPQVRAPRPPIPAGLGERLRRPAALALLLACAAWAVILGLILSHPIFVTNDSLNNYVHVWYVSQQLWDAHSFPLHVPALAGGRAFAFPYGFLPWFTAAVARPVLGDWAVTLWLVLGFVGVVAAGWWAFPELRGGWWTAGLLLNPGLVESPLLGQLPFLWSAALMLASIALWRRHRHLAAAVAAGAAIATHVPVMLPIAAVLVAARLHWEPDRRRLLACFCLSLLITAPVVVLIYASPVVGDLSRGALLVNFLQTVSMRALVIAAPFIGLAVLRTPLRRAPALVLVILIGLNIMCVPARRNAFAWQALTRSPDTMNEFLASPAFVPGARYRLLRADDGKVGMYELVRHGGRLDSEFFPESIRRRSWPSPETYAALLEKRGVDYVVVYRSYDRRYRTNEHHLLEQAALSPAASAPLCVDVAGRGPDYDVYHVTPGPCARVSLWSLHG